MKTRVEAGYRSVPIGTPPMKHLYVRFQWIALYSRRGPAWVLKHTQDRPFLKEASNAWLNPARNIRRKKLNVAYRRIARLRLRQLSAQLRRPRPRSATSAAGLRRRSTSRLRRGSADGSAGATKKALRSCRLRARSEPLQRLAAARARRVELVCGNWCSALHVRTWRENVDRVDTTAIPAPLFRSVRRHPALGKPHRPRSQLIAPPGNLPRLPGCTFLW